MNSIEKLIMFHMAVDKADEVKAFYEDNLGFKTTADTAYGGQRWISMQLPGGGVSLNLTTAHENMKPGTLKLYVSTPDVEAAYKDLKAKGVKVSDQINTDLYGPGSGVRWFDFNDPDGNHWIVVQP